MDGRSTRPRTPQVTLSANIIDPEMDMCRSREVPLGALARLHQALRQLWLDGRNMVSPMRSIGRELEESWPAREG